MSYFYQILIQFFSSSLFTWICTVFVPICIVSSIVLLIRRFLQNV